MIAATDRHMSSILWYYCNKAALCKLALNAPNIKSSPIECLSPECTII